jgi:hypothetical protein
MNQIWWGEFVDASGVWTSQGHGQARPLGRQRVVLPSGPAFAALPSVEAPWPTASRRELGHQWHGYDLDAERRPVFRYSCDGVDIFDAPRELELEDGEVGLRRTVKFATEKTKTIHFLVARHEKISEVGERTFAVGESLRVKTSLPAMRKPAVDGQTELRVEIPVRQGRLNRFVVDYVWHEEGK